MTETVGFIGLGHMGEGMSRRLLGIGKKLIVWNRSEAKAKALEAESKGAVKAVSTPAAVVRQCSVTYIMLSTPEAVRSVYTMPEGVLAGVSNSKAIIDCATLAVEDMEYLASEVIMRGDRFVEAPVSGSKKPAADGQLIFLAAGDEKLYKERAADFDAMGKAKFFFGKVGGGTRVKLAVNMMMGTMLASLGEGLSLTAAAGIEAKLLLEVLDLGVMACPMYKLKGPKMLASDYVPNFPLKHAQKDVRLAVNLGASLGLGLPVAAATDVTMLASMAKGFGDYDFAAVYEAQKKAPTTGGAMPLSSVAVLCVASGLLGAWIALKMKK